MREEMYSNEDGLANDSLSNGDTSVNLNKQTALAPQASKQMWIKTKVTENRDFEIATDTNFYSFTI